MDDQRLKEMLSAWFDGELAPQEMTLVEAYIERSEEARQIVAGFKALKQLSDESVLNPESDYWERSAARIEAALGEAGQAKITPVKRSGWSEWGWKAVSLAASVMMLTYVGLHSPEILDRLRDKPVERSTIQEKARDDQSIQQFENVPRPLNQKDKREPVVKKRRTPLPTPAPKQLSEEDKRRVEPEQLVEQPRDRKSRAKENVSAEQPVEPDDEVSQYKPRRVVSKTELRTSGEVSLSDENKASVTTLAAPARGQTVVVDSIEADLDQIEFPGYISEALEEDGEKLTFYDSTSVDATEEEQATYYWNHVVLVKMAAMRAVAPKVNSFEGGGQYLDLSSGLKDSGSRSSKTDEKGKRQKKEARQRAIEQERKAIDAAFYMGQKPDKRGTALKYLKYMAKENDETLGKPYALKKWEELRDL